MAFSNFILLLASFSAVAFSQDLGSDLTLSATGSLLCNETFSDANVTSISSYSPGVPEFSSSSGFARDIHVGATVVESTDSVQWSLWYNTGGANYSNDDDLGYDVCVFVTNTPDENTYLRGQSDPGDCSSTLNAECNAALTNMANSLALGLISNATPPPNSNLTEGSLSRVCYEIGNTIQNNFPDECNVFYNGSAMVSGSPLSSYGSSVSTGDPCPIVDDSTNRTFDHILTISGSATRLNYIAFNYVVFPMMITWLPVANVLATQTITTANSVMACLRADDVQPGSDTVPAPAAPTPIGSEDDGLTGGAIAGIVVGVVAGLGIVAGAGWWFWRRSKKAKLSKLRSSGEDTPPAYDAEMKQLPTPLAGVPANAPLAELAPDEVRRHELGVDPTFELGEGRKLAQEKALNERSPVEMSAEVPAWRLR
ncbi:uncharacterized protein LTR77_002450 [Saxophila tyrrhenica]|uniref:Uncharacterized protein n=1 Tax=Saxophila tyrrhenica TaxID=1690608 RepID=A0AAV9PJJ0_9PEZI|nr:hypothetical protein LTR77_002450 [Saxophila tyrrhenica]